MRERIRANSDDRPDLTCTGEPDATWIACASTGRHATADRGHESPLIFNPTNRTADISSRNVGGSDSNTDPYR